MSPAKSRLYAMAGRLAPLAVLLLLGCGLRPLGSSAVPASSEPVVSSLASKSALPDASVEPAPCGVFSTYEWTESIGSTPEEALSAFKETVEGQTPTDAKEGVLHTALVTALEVAVATETVEAVAKYESTVEGEIVGKFEVGPFPGGGYVVTSSWVPVPDELFCADGGNG